MIRSRWFLLLSMTGVASAAVWVAAGQAAGNGGQQPAGDKVPIFHANANLVLVDVVVRDKDKPVEGLAKAGFQVLEDGKPQAISVFEEHKASDVEIPANVPALPAHVYGNAPTYRITSAANVLLLDSLNTALNDQTYARAQMLKYLHAIPAGTQIAVFTLGSQLRMISGFTTDVSTIEEALKNNPRRQSVMVDPSSDVEEKRMNTAMAAGVPGGHLPVEQMAGFGQNQTAFREDQRTDITLGAFSELARYLSTVPGRKNLIWVSGGLSQALDPALSRMNSMEAARFSPAVRLVNAQLTQARIAVYPVDARSQMAPPDASLANVVAPPDAGAGRDMQLAVGDAVQNDVTIPQQWAVSQEEMKLVASDTGGEAFFNTNAIGKAVEKAIADGENYYTLGYAPPDTKNDGVYHKIVVEIEGRKYDLSYRRGYFAASPNETGQAMPMLSAMAEAMESGVPPLSQILFKARVLPAGDPELEGLQPTPGPAGKPGEPLKPPVTRYFVDYLIDPHALSVKDLAGGKQQMELEVAQAVYDAQGKRLNSTDAGLQVTLTADQMAADMKNGVRVRQEIDVPGEPVRLRLGVRDATNGEIGTLEVGLDGKP